MLSQGRAYLQAAPHIVLFPSLAIMLAVLAFNLFGDALNDALNPRLAHHRSRAVPEAPGPERRPR
jgi:ABC-type dipeptide/oligopeptide/nickel transport system permease subunit